MDEIQLLYDLLTGYLISSSFAGRIKKLNKPHIALKFGHVWSLVIRMITSQENNSFVLYAKNKITTKFGEVA